MTKVSAATLENFAPQSKVLGLFGIVYESIDELTFEQDFVNGEPISINEISRKYKNETR